MTSPRSAHSDGSKRFYSWRNERYWSVTTILQAYPKYALVPWTAKLVATDAVDKLDVVKALVEADGRDAAIDMLKRAGNRFRDKKAELGANVHLACEAYALGKPMPPWGLEVKPYMENFVAFLDEYRPKIHMAEASVYSRSEKYAGTLDAIANFGRRKLLLDVKTGKNLYPEMAMQCAAYRYAEFIGLPDGSERAMPALDGAGILHLTADGYDFREVDSSDNIWRSFLYLREVFRFVNETGKHVLGPTIKPPRKRARPKETAPGQPGSQVPHATSPTAVSSGNASAQASEPEPQAEGDPATSGESDPGLGASADAPSGSEQSTLLPSGPRTREQEEALGIDIFGEAVS